MSENPFGVANPEQLDADYIARNFVDVFTDMPRLLDHGNTFILGARGTGKSMLLRSLEPAVMLKLGKAASFKDLPYIGIHVPLKAAEFGVQELRRLDGYARHAIGEHLLVMQIMFRIAGFLRSVGEEISTTEAAAFRTYFIEAFLASGGEPTKTQASLDDSSAAIFKSVRDICEKEIVAVRQYYTRLPFRTEIPTYSGALTGFLDFLVPIASQLRVFENLPDVPLFIMLDDADNLPRHLQRILNSWVSTRSTQAICLKISTQLGYATHKTVDNRLIESPHDFSEVNLSTIYTNDQENYNKRVQNIIEKRFSNAGIDARVDEFFPKDLEQAKRLEAIKAEIRAGNEETPAMPVAERKGSSRIRDDVQRYAVPRLMRELAGASRSSHTYSYAGFRSLVDLSSGVVRWFLEPASRMYDTVTSQQLGPVTSIPVNLQDRVVLEWSKEFLYRLSHQSRDGGPDEDDTIVAAEDASLHALGHETARYDQLRNLLDGLGLLFRKRLLDQSASEQRLFSIVLAGIPRPDLKEVLQLGIRLGYLQQSDNASKTASGGRQPRYILARRLGPHYRLDVSGYAAHLSVTASDLEIAMVNPSAFVAQRLKLTESDAAQATLELASFPNG